ncbi:MAG: Rpn family recombination-promoting nuclease/putative transposase, partial [Clostridiales bacterium]|nr:Rpn family recombination-promoting nuclease/putative transposase [Clostridiales bacterium]
MKNRDNEIIIPDILPPSDDRVFRSIMIHPDAKPGLIDLLSASIGIPVREAEIRNSELPVDDVSEKQERLDLNCRTDAGQAAAEMQAQAMEGDNRESAHKNVIERSVYNWADLHSS